MHPSDAARQLQYAVASKADTDDYQIGHWETHAYQDVFADVADRGELSDVMSVVEELGDRCCEGSHPTPAEAREIADGVLSAGGRPLTDGGDGK
ncbi:hypothetical protein [Halobellus sp. GM3]|uniref:hypothetical protein n=1 Tax=Halobellus sp. GM3 TaxID=3458410 RepID=UPI00403E1D11